MKSVRAFACYKFGPTKLPTTFFQVNFRGIIARGKNATGKATKFLLPAGRNWDA